MTNADNSASFSEWKVLKWVFICWAVGMAFLSSITNLGDYQTYERTVKLHHDIQQQGVKTTATAYEAKCEQIPKSNYDYAKGFYHYQVNNKTYDMTDSHTMAESEPCRIKIGDTLNVYYLPDKPYLHLIEEQVKQGVPKEFQIDFFMKLSWGLLITYCMTKLLIRFYRNIRNLA